MQFARTSVIRISLIRLVDAPKRLVIESAEGRAVPFSPVPPEPSGQRMRLIVRGPLAAVATAAGVGVNEQSALSAVSSSLTALKIEL